MARQELHFVDRIRYSKDELVLNLRSIRQNVDKYRESQQEHFFPGVDLEEIEVDHLPGKIVFSPENPNNLPVVRLMMDIARDQKQNYFTAVGKAVVESEIFLPSIILLDENYTNRLLEGDDWIDQYPFMGGIVISIERLTRIIERTSNRVELNQVFERIQSEYFLNLVSVNRGFGVTSEGMAIFGSTLVISNELKNNQDYKVIRDKCYRKGGYEFSILLDIYPKEIDEEETILDYTIDAAALWLRRMADFQYSKEPERQLDQVSVDLDKTGSDKEKYIVLPVISVVGHGITRERLLPIIDSVYQIVKPIELRKTMNIQDPDILVQHIFDLLVLLDTRTITSFQAAITNPNLDIYQAMSEVGVNPEVMQYYYEFDKIWNFPYYQFESDKMLKLTQLAELLNLHVLLVYSDPNYPSVEPLL